MCLVYLQMEYGSNNVPWTLMRKSLSNHNLISILLINIQVGSFMAPFKYWNMTLGFNVFT